ncbi:hypothetical protein VRU48_14375 [Pedobacter sp. KR3-3]|uniref:Uncharacterized protein n=1 Tax=Pedobacter albus TaxID=3113905 RepID=A0ABU7I9Z7_9SPHI|nr:hypothetical protein [Pedobacter sp. KR3-3]MEE1946307.1 hypothetical protein [Pedobacter sp. KR3-3]
MLQKLSYFNLFVAILYMVVYLKSGSLTSTSGILAIVVLNWLALRSFQLADYRWKIWFYPFALWAIYYAGLLVYGLVNVIVPAIEYSFMSNDNLIYVTLTAVLVAGVLWHAVAYFLKNLKTQSS